MSGISFLGSYSGIDSSVVDQLIEAEKAKGSKFTVRKNQFESKQKAWKDINSKLDAFLKQVEKLAAKETFQTKSVTSSVKDSSFLSVKANEDAAVGQYRVQVQQLAEVTRLTGGRVDTDSIAKALDVSGSFTIENADGDTYEIEVTEKDSLKTIVNKINKETEKSGIQATIVDNRLVLTDTKLGERELSISADGDLKDRLGFADVKVDKGQDAKFTVNGLEITRDSNTIDDAIEGVTFELTNVHRNDDSEVIRIEQDTEEITNSVKKFVDEYNEIMKEIKKQTDIGDPTAKDNKTGALTGDGTLMRLQTSLRTMLTNTLEGNYSGDIRKAEDLGISVDRDGVASFNEEAFTEVLREDPTNVARFFYSQETVKTPVESGEEGEEATTQEKRGMSELFKNLVDTYVGKSTGIIANKNTTYERLIKDIDRQIETFNERVERKRERYIRQFSAVDTAMMQAESQMQMMMSQLGMGQQ